MHQRLQTKRHPPGIKVCGATSQQLSTTSVLRCPPLRTWKAKNLRRGKVLTGECQMWRGPPSSIAGKAANNHFYVWVCRYPIPVATQNGVDCTCTCTGNLPHQAPVLFNRKNSTVSVHLMLGSVIIVISREMSVPNMTVSGLALHLSLSPPSN